MHYKAVLTLIGGILIHLTLGTLYTSSNLTTYVLSYLHVVKGYKEIDSSLSPWVFGLQALGQAICMLIGGTLQRILGVKPAIILGSLCVSLSTVCGYWTVNNYILLCATYGFIFGLGVGLAYSSPMTAAMKWLPNNRGLANGLIVFGFGFGSLIFNFVQTLFINPYNAKPVLDPTGATEEYFFPASIASRTPRVFIILGVCYFLMQVVGLLLIFEPNEEERKQIEQSSSQPLLTGNLDEEGINLSKSLKTVKFWQIWATMLCVSMTNVFISSFYKFFGQTFISNDYFLSLVGSISSICNGICRPFWGWLNDKIGYKKTMSAMLILFTIFIFTFSLSKLGGEWMFMLWVCMLYFCVGGAFAVLPTYTDSCFGHKYFGTIYGMVFTSVIFSSIVSAFFVTMMVKKIGVLGITIALGSLFIIAIIFTLVGKNWTYRDYVEPLAEVKAEAPKPEEPKPEEPKAEEPKAEEPKAEEPKAEEPKAEEPKPEEPKPEEAAPQNTDANN